jgi:AcrR family transcriptional regulator
MSDVKQRVLEAAKTLYADGGYAGLSMRRVAKEAGVSTMASYRHYENKEHLLHELQVHAFALYIEKYLRPLLEIADPWQAVRESQRAYGRFALDDTAYFEIAFMATDEITGLKALTEEGRATIEEAFETSVEITRRAVGAEHALKETLRGWAMMHGMLALHLAGRLKFLDVEFTDFYESEMDEYFERLNKAHARGEKKHERAPSPSSPR